MEIDGQRVSRDGVDNFRAIPHIDSDLRAVSDRANEVARILEGPASPTSPRYDNLELGPVRDAIIRVEKGVPFEITVADFTQAEEASRTFLDARAQEADAKKRKDSAAVFLIGLARRIPNFRGIGFPGNNSSATIVVEKNKSVPDEKIDELVKSAGTELHEVATQQLELTINVPVSLTDRNGNQLTTEELEKRLTRSLKRMLRPDDRGLFSFSRKLKVHDWRRMAKLIRDGKVSPELVKASEDFVVKPIALSQIPEKDKNVPQ